MSDERDIVERLRAEQSACQDMRYTAQNELQDAAADEIERLRAALEFYAAEKNWKTEWDNQSKEYVMDAMDDAGRRARAALYGADMSDERDIVKETRDQAAWTCENDSRRALSSAADEIERLREALKDVQKHMPDYPDTIWQNAAEALKPRGPS